MIEFHAVTFYMCCSIISSKVICNGFAAWGFFRIFKVGSAHPNIIHEKSCKQVNLYGSLLTKYSLSKKFFGVSGLHAIAKLLTKGEHKLMGGRGRKGFGNGNMRKISMVIFFKKLTGMLLVKRTLHFNLKPTYDTEKYTRCIHF